jgi:addiction module HigA family antidote
MNKRHFAPIHPGEILLEEFLKPMEISQEQLAEDTNIPLPKITGIVRDQQDINADLALRLGHFFGMEAQFWMNLQVRYDLICTQTKPAEHLLKEVRSA